MTSATPPVATTYSWKDGHTVDVNGTRVIPLIDVKLLDASDADRTEFFKLLRYAVTDVGFLYLKNVPGLNQSFIDAVIAQCHAFFAQPEDAKAEIHMGKSKHFRGWTKLGDERTQYHQNLRENLDLGFELEPVKDNLGHTWRDLFIGPNQWPDETKFPEFKSTMMRYIDAAYKTEMLLIRLILSIFNLPENYLDKYFTFPEREDQPQPFCLCKIAYYPKVEVTPELRAKVPTLFDSDGYLQGCGAHKDNSVRIPSSSPHALPTNLRPIRSLPLTLLADRR